MALTFFARPHFWGHDFSLSETETYLHRATSLIRGEQLAGYIGANYNPTEGYAGDILVYVKPKRVDHHIRDGAWVDVGDGDYLVWQLLGRSGVKAIFVSRLAMDFALGQGLANEMCVIPEYHVNWERLRRQREGLSVGGYLGSAGPKTVQLHERMRGELEGEGIEFRTCYDFKSRRDVSDFYLGIDFQVVAWPPLDPYNPFRYPNKLVNAASFGIPSIAWWRHGYRAFEGCYLPVRSAGDILAEVRKLRDRHFYDDLSGKIMGEAERYHIDNVTPLYRQLT